MAEIKSPDIAELAKVLDDAKMRFETITKGGGVASVADQLRKLAPSHDTNSGCNTSCLAGPAPQSLVEKQ